MSISISPCNYMGIVADDSPNFDLSQHFERAASFIDAALAVNSAPAAPPVSPQAPRITRWFRSLLGASAHSASTSRSPTSRVPTSKAATSSSAVSGSTTGSNMARVLVHCREGYSRSPTIVIAYLLLRQRDPLRLEDAVRVVARQLSIGPNKGFLRQLVRLDRRLRTQNAY